VICRQCKKWNDRDVELADHVAVMEHLIAYHGNRALILYKKVTAVENVFHNALADEALRDRCVEGEYT